MGGSGRASARAAAVPVAGLVLTYGLATLTPLGRRLDLLATNGRFGAGWPVQAGDLLVLETVSVATFVLALAALVLVSGLRGRWELGLRGVLAVLGSILSAEVLKYLLPGQSRWTGQWSWIGGGTFPSGHAVIVTSIALAVLSISSDHWRRLLVGPLVAGTAIATTATVTVGWHNPSDVLGSLFLATAWHRAMTVSAPADRRLRTLLPRVPHPPAPTRPPFLGTALWWAAASALVLGAAVEGALTRTAFERLKSMAYVGSLGVVLTGVLLTIALGLHHQHRQVVAAPVATTSRK